MTAVSRGMILFLAIALAACDGKGGSGTDHCGDVKTFPSDIVGGTATPDSTVVTLSGAQEKAVVMLYWDVGQLCSGTLVAPRVVVTAAICGVVGTATPPDHVFYGPDGLAAEGELDVASMAVHPSFDMTTDMMRPSVIVLGEDATLAGMEPLPIPDSTTSLAGEDVLFGGYGATVAGDSFTAGVRHWTGLHVDAETATSYTASNGTAGACMGDAGGPMLWVDPTDGLIAAGIAVAGAEDCIGDSFFARLDLADPWLAAQILAADPCDGETIEGRCDGDTAIWCEAEAVETEDCAATGMVCGLDPADHSRCVAPLDPCDGETLAGRCDGEVAIWCEADAIETVDCTVTGQLCGVDPASRHRCMAECDAMGFEGRCAGDVARWCEDGVVLERDCAECEQACGDTAGDLGFYCM